LVRVIVNVINFDDLVGIRQRKGKFYFLPIVSFW